MANSPGARRQNQLMMTLIVVGCCVVAVLPAFVVSALRAGGEDGSALFDVRMLLGGALLLATIAVMTVRKLWLYYLTLTLQQILIVAFAAAFAEITVVYAAILTFGIVELSFIEPYPRSLVMSLAVAAATLAILLSAGAPLEEGAIRDPVAGLAPMVPLFGLAILGPRVTRFREMMAQTVRERDHLGESVVNLTRANSEYQDFAVLATEYAAEQERLRITREIHDVVGYTLTNNIMLMEAALRLMQENVLALPTIIETARSNAQEGLVEIRKELYKLRLVEPEYPSGVNAIHRLVRMFQEATGVTVRCDFCNAPWTVSEQVDSALYHMVQESLVNSYRHGRASNVQITFWREDNRIVVDIDDDGVGAIVIDEGIGLKGMRERMEAVSGVVSVSAGPGRFAIRAEVPVGDSADG
jgi:signal transduction histidine kinase